MQTIEISGRDVELGSVEIDGIDTTDYPDFCDAFAAYAEFIDGTPLNDSELDELNDNRGVIYELTLERVF